MNWFNDESEQKAEWDMVWDLIKHSASVAVIIAVLDEKPELKRRLCWWVSKNSRQRFSDTDLKDE